MNTPSIDNLISTALEQRIAAISYSFSKALATIYPDRYILESDSGAFDLAEFAADGHCTSALNPGAHNQIETTWQGAEYALDVQPKQAWINVTWRAHKLEVIKLSWPSDCGDATWFFIIAANRKIAEEFFFEVCRWCSEVRGEVLVFERGYWDKSTALYNAIAAASYDRIILAGDLKQRIHEDFASFFAARPMFERYGVPWKRGALLIGPPGNGKTQMVKAIINAMEVPCLYVKSLAGDRADGHINVRAVFARARQTTPCILVLEDLDSLVTPHNRSFFLNEMDGFAANTGIVVLATTNHPERLDPAILDRPSRFDRKYHFNLPGQSQRVEYLEMWNAGLEPALKLSVEGVEATAAATEGYSFAYLKELMLSSVMAWMEAGAAGPMDPIVLHQAAKLTEQMAYMEEELPPVDADTQDEDEDA